MTITITAMKWVPTFARGQVRDHRVRWILNEVGWPYEVRLLDAEVMASKAYASAQPFGQVPILEEDGRPTLFETGSIIFDVATRAGKLIPTDPGERALMLSYYFAALNSVEPFLMNVAEVEYFMSDESHKALRRPAVVSMAERRLDELENALDTRKWFVGDDFTIADLMISSVMKIAGALDLLSGFPMLAAHQERSFARPAYQRAVADQCAAIDRHGPGDMKYDAVRRN